jgi:hypothetical protein
MHQGEFLRGKINVQGGMPREVGEPPGWLNVPRVLGRRCRKHGQGNEALFVQ